MESNSREPIQKRSMEKKDQLLEAALLLFSEHGYYKVTSKMIAKEAGVAIGSFYAYFDDKLDIYIQLVHDFKSQIGTILEGLSLNNTTTPDFESMISSLIDEIVAIIQGYPKGFYNQLLVVLQLEPTVKMAYKSQMDGIQLTIEKILQGNHITADPIDTSTLAYFITQMNEQLINLIMMTDDIATKDALKKTYVEMLSSYLHSKI